MEDEKSHVEGDRVTQGKIVIHAESQRQIPGRRHTNSPGVVLSVKTPFTF